MRTFFIHVDRHLWHTYFLPAFCEHLEDAPDTVDHLIEIIKEYVLFRYENTTQLISGAMEVGEETPVEMVQLVLINENIHYVNVIDFARLLEDFYGQLHCSLVQVGPPEGLREFQPHQTNTTLLGFSGYQVLQ
jgi:hypothetical protein